jgi:hypothetical protein
MQRLQALKKNALRTKFHQKSGFQQVFLGLQGHFYLVKSKIAD